MELSQEMLIDLALNAAGYLIAALLGVTLYSICTHKKRQSTVTTTEKAPVTSPVQTEQADLLQKELSEPETLRKMEFIKFGSTPVMSPESVKKPVQPKTANLQNSRPTKVEIIKLARKMLSAGAPTENIKKVLPISDAELALLQLNNNS